MQLGNLARVLAVSVMCFAAVGSATSSNNTVPNGQPPSGPNGAGPLAGPPAAAPMEATRALGLWRSTFGAVKIEEDASRGGLAAGALQGVWVYQRRGQEVIGYFSGALRGNVLEFKWQEPNNPPLTGAGYLVFDAGGRQYSGKWWSDARDRQGDWNGWRQAPGQDMGQAPQPAQPSPYGGNPYGGRTYGNPNPYAPGPQPQAPQAPQPQPYGPQAPGPNMQPNPYGPAQPPSR